MSVKRLALLLVCLLLPLQALADDDIFLDGIYNKRLESPFTQENDLLEVWFPKIKDCDTALLRCGGENVLIDTGTDKQAERMVNLLQALDISHLDAVYISHPHHDHCGGFATLADAVQVDAVYTCFPEDTNEHSLTLAAEA